MIMNPLQKVLFPILIILALFGLGYRLFVYPFQTLTMFVITLCILFLIKKFAIDPVYGRRSAGKKTVQPNHNRDTLIRRKPLEQYPFKVIEGKKNKERP
jgi:hypothetical protein